MDTDAFDAFSALYSNVKPMKLCHKQNPINNVKINRSVKACNINLNENLIVYNSIYETKK